MTMQIVTAIDGSTGYIVTSDAGVDHGTKIFSLFFPLFFISFFLLDEMELGDRN